jgi:hypothetical protein
VARSMVGIEEFPRNRALWLRRAGAGPSRGLAVP